MKQAMMVGLGLLMGVIGVAQAATCTWTGSWDTTPSGASDVIVVSSGGAMTWDASLPATVASWTQDATYAGTVTVATVYGPSGFTNFTVTGDVTLKGGVWTHLANTGGETNRLCVTVNGNLFITNATINVDIKGYDKGSGPGGSTLVGGTYGGVASFSGASLRTYGAIASPTNLGSGGKNNAGGGAVILSVAGTSTVAGVISAWGQGSSASDGAGGSVFLTTGWLTGNGMLKANGGDGYNNGRSGGGGGRVAIVLTGAGAGFGDWKGSNTTYGGKGWLSPNERYGSAGTVYRAAGGVAAGGGTVTVDNNNSATNDTYTALPAFTNSVENVENLTNTTWIVQNRGKIKVVANATISNLTMNTNSYLDLGGKTLTLQALTITNKVFSEAIYTAAELGGLVSDSSGGNGLVIVGDPVFPPLIDTLNPSNITTTSADMNGTLTTNGSSPATVRLYWGPSDGTDNPSAWATNITLAGTFNTGSALTTNITGLDPNTLYYYRYYATNEQVEKWAPSYKSFINGGVGIKWTSDASEIGTVPGTFTVYRASSATNVALTLNYARTGFSATSDVDYAALPMSVTIPAGATNAPIAVTPLLNWAKLYDTTLELTLTSGVPICIFDVASNATMTITNRTFPYSAPTNIWAAAADGNASVAGNWSLSHTPTNGETVLLGEYSTRNLTWDSAATNTVTKWVQEAGYTGTVTIATTYSAPFTNFTVLGDVTLNRGSWTHLENTGGETNRLCVTVGGNLFLTNATINVELKGYSKGSGPGGSTSTKAGGTYGGVGTDSASLRTYGAIASPTNLGSGGKNSAGGGAVILSVAGTSTVAGVISARGQATGSQAGDGAGGSVFLTTGWLTGKGMLQANGGDGGNYGWAGGGGGRVAIVLTGAGAGFGDWKGSNTTYGGAGTLYGAAGTVYQAAGGVAAGGGTVIVDNNNSATNDTYTALPAFTNPVENVENLAASLWIAQNKGKIKVVNNATIWSLTMNTNSYLELAGSTLTLTALTITNHVFSAGTYGAAQLGGLVSDSSGSSGQVVVTGLTPRGTLMMIH